MPTHRVKNAKQLAVELPAEFVSAFKAWVLARGEKISPVVMLALQRHMAQPPVVSVPPLDGELPTATPPKKRGRPKKADIGGG